MKFYLPLKQRKSDKWPKVALRDRASGLISKACADVAVEARNHAQALEIDGKIDCVPSVHISILFSKHFHCLKAVKQKQYWYHSYCTPGP